MAMHPADLEPHELKIWTEGFAHLDTLMSRGLSDRHFMLYVQGLRARLIEEEYRALHPDMFKGRRDGV